MKQDKRYIKTEKLIYDAFFSLLKTESYNSITVEKSVKMLSSEKTLFTRIIKTRTTFFFL